MCSRGGEQAFADQKRHDLPENIDPLPSGDRVQLCWTIFKLLKGCLLFDLLSSV
jgi:hypothetical protein